MGPLINASNDATVYCATLFSLEILMADDKWSDAKTSYCSRALPNLFLRIVLVCAPAVMYAQSAGAQLPPGTSRLFAGTIQGGNFNLEFPGTGDLFFDGSFTTAEGSHAEERSRAETFGGATPSAIAEAEATSTSAPS